MIRDFSEKAKQKLEGYADDAAASSTSGKIKDWFSDRGMDFRSWAGTVSYTHLFLGWQCRRNGIGRSEETYAIFDGKHFKEVKGK